jgi:hypothetical protein
MMSGDVRSDDENMTMKCYANANLRDLQSLEGMGCCDDRRGNAVIAISQRERNSR